MLIHRAGGPDELARRAGLSRRVVDKYRAGDSDPSRSRLVALARAGNASVAWLATGEGPLDQGEFEGLTGPAPAWMLPLGPPLGDLAPIPRYELGASAGAGVEVSEPEVINDWLMISQEWISRTLRTDPQNLAVIEVTGDSMAPTIDHGDLLLVDVSERHIRGEGIYVLNVSGALLVKRVSITPRGTLVLQSDNERYPDYSLGPTDVDEARIIGRVVWSGGRV